MYFYIYIYIYVHVCIYVYALVSASTFASISISLFGPLGLSLRPFQALPDLSMALPHCQSLSPAATHPWQPRLATYGLEVLALLLHIGIWSLPKISPGSLPRLFGPTGSHYRACYGILTIGPHQASLGCPGSFG